MRRVRFGLLPGLLLLLVGVGCSQDDPARPDPPTSPAPPGEVGFEARATGGVERVLEGAAVFSPDASGEEFGFAIALIDAVAPAGEVRHAVYFFRERTGVPSPGEHVLGEDGAELEAGVVFDGDGMDPLFCSEITGTLELTEASAQRVSGSFRLEATCLHVGGEPADPVELRGTFLAEAGTVGDEAGGRGR